MARIPEAEIERLKEAVPMERLVEASGIELKKGGKDLLGCCPFHADDTASLVVTPGENLWHCFGCGIGGGPIDWVMKCPRGRKLDRPDSRSQPTSSWRSTKGTAVQAEQV